MTTRLDNCTCCGRELEFPLDEPIVVCPGCQTKNKYPDERLLNRTDFRNARELQKRDEFCDAEESYQRVLDDFPDDADALWGRLMCHYGAKLLVGPKSQRRFTIRIPRSKPLRAQGDYERAIEAAQPEMREQYEQDAAYIDRAMEAIRAIASTKPPYDIFLCHKTTPIGGRGYTEDYVRARNLHDLLTKEGYRAFFAPVDMEGISGGEDYEAGIYHALNTAKVMLVVCSDPQHLDSTWVKSEWQRFLALRDEGKQVALIPLLYGGMRAGALPRAFHVRNLQAVKMELEGKDTLLERLEQLIPREKPEEKAPEVPAQAPVAAKQPAAPVQPVSAQKEKPAKSRVPLLLFILLVLLVVIGFDALSSWLRGDDLSLPPAGGGGNMPIVQTEEPAAPTATITASPAPTVAARNVAYSYYELEDLGEIMACLDISWSEDGVDWQIAWLNLSDPDAALVIANEPVRVYRDEGIAKLPIGDKTHFWGQTYRFFIYPKGDTYDGPTSYSFTYSFPETPTLTPEPSATLVPTATSEPTLVDSGVKHGDYTIDVYSNGTCVITDYHGRIENLVVPGLLEGYVVTSIWSNAFWGSYMVQLTLPDSVTKIGNDAFRECGALKSVMLSPNISSISAYAFYHCRSLESVTIPGSVRYIGGSAFAYCTSLTDVTIQSGVMGIGLEAFQGCTSLTSVTIPDSVTEIDYRVFMHCPNLTLRVPRNSYAATYAQENDIPYTYID